MLLTRDQFDYYFDKVVTYIGKTMFVVFSSFGSPVTQKVKQTNQTYMSYRCLNHILFKMSSKVSFLFAWSPHVLL